jgi:sarcosine oxidase/L-pipecolate oxidase
LICENFRWTNFKNVKGQQLSVPKTAHTPEKETNIPFAALNAIKGPHPPLSLTSTNHAAEFISSHLPELKPLGISKTRLCWYTDSIDNSFMIDHVPTRPRLMVCSGGSGHGFKFLPILGREVVKIIEGEKNVYGKMWEWRMPKECGKNNGLEEGENGWRVLGKQRMASEEDWRFDGGKKT